MSASEDKREELEILGEEEDGGVDNDLEEEGDEEEIEDLCEELIGAVRENPILWDHTRNDFKKSRDLKNAAWKAVSRVVEKPGNINIAALQLIFLKVTFCNVDTWCKTRWEKLRHSFTRKKKSLKGKTGQARKKIEEALKCGNFLLMKFLDDVPQEAR